MQSLRSQALQVSRCAWKASPGDHAPSTLQSSFCQLAVRDSTTHPQVIARQLPHSIRPHKGSRGGALAATQEPLRGARAVGCLHHRRQRRGRRRGWRWRWGRRREEELAVRWRRTRRRAAADHVEEGQLREGPQQVCGQRVLPTCACHACSNEQRMQGGAHAWSSVGPSGAASSCFTQLSPNNLASWTSPQVARNGRDWRSLHQPSVAQMYRLRWAPLPECTASAQSIIICARAAYMLWSL